MNYSFVAIDFETACYSTLSACSFGLAVFENGKKTLSKYWLMKPIDPGKFSFTKIHGLTLENVKDEKSFLELWPEIKPYLDNKLIIAHNAVFDLGILKENLTHLNIEYNNYPYNCTMNLCKHHISMLKDYKLETICSFFNLPYGKHNAEGDAIACGEVFSILMKTIKYPEDLFIGHFLENKSYRKSGPSFRSQKPANLEGIEIDDVDQTVDADFFKGKNCLITGLFEKYDRLTLPTTLKNLGANITSSPIKSLDYLIMGSEPGWSKIDKVKEMQNQGKPIIIMDESELNQVLMMIDSKS